MEGVDSTGATFGDLDGDGDLDLIVNSVGQGTSVLRNDGKGHFTLAAKLNPNRGGMSLALADIDGDGDLDLYVTNYRSGTLSVIRGTEIVATLETHGEGAWYIGVDEIRGYIYVSNADSHSVAVFGFPETAPPSFWQRFLPFIQR